MVKVVNNLSYNNNYYNILNTRQYITIHETSNTSVGANADAHANYINNGGSMETWHYTVDDTKAVKHYKHITSCWHAGTYAGNTQSIGIEMCVNQDGNYKKTLQNTIELVKEIMRIEHIPASNVVQHNYWSGKNCPMLLRSGQYGMTWNQFKSQLKQKSKVGIWTVNKYGTYYRKRHGIFKVGNEPIITRISSPFANKNVKKGQHGKVGEEIEFHTACIQDGYYWLEFTNEKGQEEFIPVCKTKGVPLHQTYGNLWGKYIKKK